MRRMTQQRYTPPYEIQRSDDALGMGLRIVRARRIICILSMDVKTVKPVQRKRQRVNMSAIPH